MRLRTALVCSLAAGFVAVAPTPAIAFCAPPPPLEESYATTELVFKGTVTGTENGDRTAFVDVEDVWKGPPLPATVEVHGGPIESGENVATSIDRSFEQGVTYLFFPTNGSEPFHDNICTATQPYKPSLERLRAPSSTGPADADDDPSDGGPAPAAGGSVPAGLPRTGIPVIGLLLGSGLATGLGTGSVLWARHRRRHP